MAYLPNSFYPSNTNPSGFIAPVTGSAPATSVLSVPVSINIFGINTAVLGLPDGFITVAITGVTKKIPYYN